MTPQEAIKQLEYDRAMCLFNPSTGEEEPMNEDCRKSAEALELAIEALESRIPKKVKMELNEFGTKYRLSCPVCDKFFGHMWVHDIGAGIMPLYCDCGQRLDWLDVDDNIPK